MNFNVGLSIIFLFHWLESFECKHILLPTGIRQPARLAPARLAPVRLAILKQNKFDTLAIAAKHSPPIIVDKHVHEGYSVEGSKKSHHEQQHDGQAKKKLIEGLHHKSSKDSTSAKKGSDTKESRNKEYDEKSGHDKKTEDEADESSFYKDGDHKVYGNQHKEAKKQKTRKFEQGFFKTYHKKERNKKSDFFEDHHKGGDYKRYGQGNERHYSTSSTKKEKKDGKISSSSSFSDSKKKSKIK